MGLRPPADDMSRTPRERGAAVVEFALVVPMLLVLVFGIIQYGMYFMAMQGGSDIARSAARMAAVGEPATCADFRSSVRSEISDLTGASSGTGAVITRHYTKAGTQVQIGDTVEIEVRFHSFDMQLPFLPFVDDGTVTSRAETRVDFVRDQPEECS